MTSRLPQDMERWSDPASYKAEWGERSRLAASLVPDGVSVFEIGVGTGVFRDLVKERTGYVGADLKPLDGTSIALDLDVDSLPAIPFDYAVALGVFSYLHRPEVAAEKLCRAAAHVIASYCCRRSELTPEAVWDGRRKRGWRNNFDRAQFVQMFTRHGHELASSRLLTITDDLEEWLMQFRRPSQPTPHSSNP